MHTVQPCITELDLGYIGYILVVNKRWFDELPPELQEIVQESAVASSEDNRVESEKVNDDAKKLIEEAGTTEIHVPSEEERDAFKDVVLPSEYEKYRPVIGDEIIDEILAVHEQEG